MTFKLQRAINEDWKVAVERYPEVLDHYYEQVNWEAGSSNQGRRAGGDTGRTTSSRTRRREVWRN